MPYHDYIGSRQLILLTRDYGTFRKRIKTSIRKTTIIVVKMISLEYGLFYLVELIPNFQYSSLDKILKSIKAQPTYGITGL